MDAQSLVSLICQEAGMDGSTGSTDRTVALSCLNRAMNQVAMETNGFADIARYSTTFRDSKLLPSPEDAGLASTADGDDSAFVNPVSLLVSLDWIGVSSSTGLTETDSTLKRVSPQRMLQLRPPANSSANTPSFYAMNWPLLMLDAVPPSGANLVMGFRRSPLVLTDSPSSVPQELHALFHQDLLAKLGTVLALEGFEGREGDAAYHRRVLGDVWSRYREWILRNAGIDYPDDGTRIAAWSTPGIASTRGASTSGANWGQSWGGP